MKWVDGSCKVHLESKNDTITESVSSWCTVSTLCNNEGCVSVAAVCHIPGSGRLTHNQLDPSVCQWGTYSIDSHSRTMSVNTQPSILYNGMRSAHQTPELLYQPVWEYHCPLSPYSTLNHPQMLWHVFCSPPFCRMWGCAPTVAVYLQEEWAVERNGNWLVDVGSWNTVRYIHCVQLCRPHSLAVVSLGELWSLLHSARQCSWKSDPHCTHPHRHTLIHTILPLI